MPPVRIKRIYDAAEADDGQRILVDRMWPRGVARAEAALDHWLPEVGPSHELRRWFGHDADRWDEFQARYRAELAESPHFVDLARLVSEASTTLLYSARDTEHNQAVVLAKALVEHDLPH